jgi:hypothetical protein
MPNRMLLSHAKSSFWPGAAPDERVWEHRQRSREVE